MFLGKGKKVMGAVDAHCSLVLDCHRQFCAFLEEYLSDGETPEAIRLAQEVDGLEGAADRKRRELFGLFREGLLLAQTRSEIIRLVEMTDDIANRAQDVSRRLLLEHVKFPQELRPHLAQIAHLTQQQLEILIRSIDALFNHYETLFRQPSPLEEIKEYEGRVDKEELLCAKILFDKELSLAEKLHAKDFISQIADISDQIEDIADAMQVMVVFRKV
ncbi:MAG: DUF47 family protein [Firmicutes bacterium]|nr:DUF47 family protein [Bacillota bacterium]